MEPILIAGAGPTGLAAALLLTERGLPVRIVDKAGDFSRQSKALGVNPRTLSLLESTGVTEQLLARGRRMQRLNVWRNGKRVIQLDLSRVKHRFNFMLIHGQGDSERLLAAALAERGVEVEHDTELTALQLTPESVQATLCLPHGDLQTVMSPTMLAADGAHSMVRRALEIDFPGDAYGESWKLIDLDLEFPLAADEGHVFLLDDGVVFALRLRESKWRLAGNLPDLLGNLPPGTSIGAPHWESEFRISNRVASKLQAGMSVYLAGDAAHIHSPLGARGMNLGVEDAYVFASLAAQNRLAEYESLRMPVIKRVVRWVSRATQIPRGTTFTSRLVRRVPGLVKRVAPWYAPSMRKWLLGLDHEVQTGES